MSQSKPTPPHSRADIDSTSSGLLARARTRDDVAWQRLIASYEPLIRCWCRKAGLNAETTEDILQDVMFSVHKALGQFQRNAGRGSFRAWLRRITQNKVYDYMRRRNKTPQAYGGSDALRQQNQIQALANDDGSDSTLLGSRQAVMKMLESLRDQFSETTWRAFFLVTFRDYSSVEAAEELGISPSAVRLANGRVRVRFREKFGAPP